MTTYPSNVCCALHHDRGNGGQFRGGPGHHTLLLLLRPPTRGRGSRGAHHSLGFYQVGDGEINLQGNICAPNFHYKQYFSSSTPSKTPIPTNIRPNCRTVCPLILISSHIA